MLPRMPRSFGSCLRFAKSALLLPFLLLLGCDDSDPAKDALAAADVVHCNMPKDQACLEYQRVRSNGADAFVALDEARAVCAAGWAGDGTKSGTFAEGACATDAALARCRIPRSHLELHYYYEGFADSETLEDPIPPLATLCQKSTGTHEQAPF